MARLVELQASHGKNPALQSFLEVAEELLDDLPHLPGEFSAQVKFARAALDIVLVNEGAFEKPFVEGLALLPKDNELYEKRLLQLAQYLSFRGRLHEIDLSLPNLNLNEDLAENDFLPSDKFLPMRFINAIEIGQIQLANSMATHLLHIPLASPMDEIVAAYDSVVVLWQDHLQMHQSKPADPFSSDDFNYSLRALLQQNRSEVFRSIEESQYEDVSAASTLYGYQSLRLSLALRDTSLASDLLSRRIQLGLGHWLDDFMWSRIALLEGDLQRASDSFTRCMRHAEAYQATDRLDFELRLSMEMSPFR